MNKDWNSSTSDYSEGESMDVKRFEQVIEAVKSLEKRVKELEDNIRWLTRATNYCGCTEKLCSAERKGDSMEIYTMDTKYASCCYFQCECESTAWKLRGDGIIECSKCGLVIENCKWKKVKLISEYDNMDARR